MGTRLWLSLLILSLALHVIAESSSLTGNRMKDQLDAMSQRVQQLEQRIQHLEELWDAELLATSSEINTPARRPKNAKVHPMDPYYQGLDCREKGDFGCAIQSFRKFLQENAAHVYADRAQYLLADSFYSNRDYGLAIVETSLLESRFPYSIKIPDALLTKGLSFIELGKREDAKATLQLLLKRFPDEAPSVKAAEKLAVLNSKIPISKRTSVPFKDQ